MGEKQHLPFDSFRKLLRKRRRRWSLQKTYRQLLNDETQRALLLKLAQHPFELSCEVSLHSEKQLLEELEAEEDEARANAAMPLGGKSYLVCCRLSPLCLEKSFAVASIAPAWPDVGQTDVQRCTSE